MAKRFLTDPVSVYVPEFSNRFLIHNDGRVYDCHVGCYLDNTDDVVLANDEVCLRINRLALLYFCFSNDSLPVKYWPVFTAGIINTDVTKPLSQRVFIRPPNGGLTLDGEHYYIPRYSNYRITKDGRIFSLLTNKYLKTYMSSLGYRMTGMQPDQGSRRIESVHRLLGLAFLQYPYNVFVYDINHKDCDKSNNDLDNLEWATRRENNLHAVANGLNIQAIPIEIRWVRTGVVESFASIAIAARKLNIVSSTLQLRVLSRGQTTYPEGFQVRRIDETLGWCASSKNKAGVRRNVSIKDTRTGEVCHFNSVNKAEAFLGIHTAVLSYRLSKHETFEWNEYVISYTNP